AGACSAPSAAAAVAAATGETATDAMKSLRSTDNLRAKPTAVIAILDGDGQCRSKPVSRVARRRGQFQRGAVAEDAVAGERHLGRVPDALFVAARRIHEIVGRLRQR